MIHKEKMENKTVNISLENNMIQSLSSYNFKNDKVRIFFNLTLSSTISNINDLKKITYNLETEIDTLKYLEVYINSIVKSMFSLNAFLIKIMLEYAKQYEFYSIFNPDTKNKENIKICNKSSNNNTVANLIYFFVQKKWLPLSLLESFAKYETIFRHQYAHGWNLFFYAFLEEMHNFETKFNYDNINNFDYIITNKNNQSQDFIREQLKIKSLAYENINLLKYIDSNLDTNGNSELLFKINSKYDPKYIMALKKFGIDTTIQLYPFTYVGEQQRDVLEVIDLLEEYINLSKNEETFMLNLSLNNLFTKIYGLVTELDNNILL